MILTLAGALALAQSCVPPAAAAVMVGIAQHESRLVSTAIHDNVSGRSYAPETVPQAVAMARALIAIGHASLDLGIAQVNVRNFGWTGLTVETAFDPCHSLAAGAAVLLAKYNGNPPDAGKAAYAADVIARLRSIDAPADTPASSPPSQPPRPPCAPSWDGWALVDCTAKESP